MFRLGFDTPVTTKTQELQTRPNGDNDLALGQGKQLDEQLDASSSCIAILPDIKIGEGVTHALKFYARRAGAGAYTFEAVQYPGFFLTVQKATQQNRPFLSKVDNADFAVLDPRFQFELYAT